MASTLTAPTPITVPFAASGSKNTIPTNSQIGVVDGAASYPDGFPPLCGTPLESGGKPPSRSDMNGILYEITANLRYILGGGIPKFNATLAASIGGYPIGAIVQDNSGENCYRNVVDGNSTDFNTTPASIGVSWQLVYGPGNVVSAATTSAQGVVELATNTEASAGTDTFRAVTPAGLAAFLDANLLAATTSIAGKVELATTTEASTATDTTRAVTPAGLASFLSAKLPYSTTSIAGKVELATSAESVTGTDTTRAVTPAGLQAKINAGSVKLVGAGYGGIGTCTLLSIDQDAYTYATGTVYTLSGLSGGWRCTGRCAVSYWRIYIFEREY